jgi:maltose alpha-D-glucosyltransferase/alpha-amylase
VHGGEQSNTSVVLGDRFILKVFRRLGVGENPDLEVGRFLTEKTDLTCVPQLAGAVEYRPKEGINGEPDSSGGGQPMTIGIMHELVANEGDAWVYTLDELGRYVERVASEMRGVEPDSAALCQKPLLELADLEVPDVAAEMISGYLQAAELLGRRTAEMHAALASGRNAAFAPEPFSKLYRRSLYQSMRGQILRCCGNFCQTCPNRRGRLPKA